MSEVYHGVIVNTDEPAVQAVFDLVKALRPLHLIQLAVDKFGFYSQPDSGSFERFHAIAVASSREVGESLFYAYDSRVGFNCSTYVCGESLADSDLDAFFRRIEEYRLNDEIIEAAFHWDAFPPINSTELMSKMHQGVILACTEQQARDLFESLDSFLRLRLAQLSDDAFAIYPGAPQLHPDYFGMSEEGNWGRGRVVDEMCRIAQHISTSRPVLWRFWDSCLGEWDRLYERGRMTREITPEAQGADDSETVQLISNLGLSAPAANLVLDAIVDGAIEPVSLGLLESQPPARDA